MNWILKIQISCSGNDKTFFRGMAVKSAIPYQSARQKWAKYISQFNNKRFFAELPLLIADFWMIKVFAIETYIRSTGQILPRNYSYGLQPIYISCRIISYYLRTC